MDKSVKNNNNGQSEVIGSHKYKLKFDAKGLNNQDW